MPSQGKEEIQEDDTLNESLGRAKRTGPGGQFPWPGPCLRFTSAMANINTVINANAIHFFMVFP